MRRVRVQWYNGGLRKLWISDKVSINHETERERESAGGGAHSAAIQMLIGSSGGCAEICQSWPIMGHTIERSLWGGGCCRTAGDRDC